MAYTWRHFHQIVYRRYLFLKYIYYKFTARKVPFGIWRADLVLWTKSRFNSWNNFLVPSPTHCACVSKLLMPLSMLVSPPIKWSEHYLLLDVSKARGEPQMKGATSISLSEAWPHSVWAVDFTRLADYASTCLQNFSCSTCFSLYFYLYSLYMFTSLYRLRCYEERWCFEETMRPCFNAFSAFCLF